jgi:hypothetical protein
VFGPMLMARATVAGTNHSNYSNLPLDGIRYIEDVCRRTLCPAGMPRQRFIDFYFRPAMKGLAARCRRIRHSLKPTEPGSSGSSAGSGQQQQQSTSGELGSSASGVTGALSSVGQLTPAQHSNLLAAARVLQNHQRAQDKHHQQQQLAAALAAHVHSAAAAAVAAASANANAVTPPATLNTSSTQGAEPKNEPR